LIPSSLILAGELYILYFLYLFLSGLIQEHILEIVPVAYLPLVKMLLTVIVNASIFGGFLTFTARLFKLLFPELSRTVYEKIPPSFRRIARILGGVKNG